MLRFSAALVLCLALPARAVESVVARIEAEYRKQRQAALGAEWLEIKRPGEASSDFLARLLDSAREGDRRATATVGWEFSQRGDPFRARSWLGRSAERGNPFAAYLLGVLSAQDARDSGTLSVDWMRRAAEAGLPEAQFELGLRSAKDAWNDAAAARSWYTLAADQDFAPALCNLATMEFRGAGGPSDASKAEQHFRAAANAGFPQGFFGLAEVLRSQNRYAEAVPEYDRAATAGMIEADFWLGCMAGEGLGQPRNATEAARHFLKAAIGGQAVAQAIAADLLRRGTGIPPDEEAAGRWDTEVERLTNPDVITTIGRVYLEGRLVQRDPVKALHFFRRAAERGEPNAQRLAGTLLATGEAGERDLQEAYQWLWLAARNGQPDAATAFQAVVQTMDGGQILEASRRASAFQARSP